MNKFTFQFKAVVAVTLIVSLSAISGFSYGAPLPGQPALVVEQEKIPIKGKVLDSDGQPLAGAMVVVKGTQNGAVTDAKGEFSFNAPKGSILEVSFIGFESQTVTLGGKTDVLVTMKTDALVTDEVVVVGFGSQKKVNLTGAVSTVSADAFKSRPVQNAAQALQGMVPGLNVTQSTAGGLDSKPNLNVRGATTIGKGSTGNPLVLVDGMEGDINTINPQDIESISVLKDAAASSIYGARAPFGVILVTTKSGKAGRIVVNYNNSFRFSAAAHAPETVDSYRFASYINEGLTNASKAKKFMPDALDRMKQFQAGTLKTNNIPDPSNPNAWANAKYNANDNVNWFDELFGGSSFSHEHTLSLNGGTEKLQVYASLNYLDQNGLLRIADDSYKRYSTNLRVTGDIFPFLDFSYNIKFNREDFSRPTQMGDGAYGQLTQAFPNMPFKDANGFYYEEDYRAPMALSIADGGDFRTRSDNMYQQLKIHADPIKNWNINAEMNYRLNSTDTHTDTQLFYNHSVDGEMLLDVKYPLSSSSVQEQHVARNYINPNIYTDYSISINDAHNFKIMLGFQAERQWISSMSAMRNGIIVPYMDQIDVTNGNSVAGKAIPPTVSGNTNNWATAGFFGRLNYDYKGRYLLEVNARYDGTSRYRVDKRWKWFPSFSAGWNVAKEKFWEDFVNTCSVLKVRASYGELGNQNTSLLYPTYQTLGIGAASGGWLWNFAKPTSVGSPNLLNSLMTWETIKSLNVGLDVAFFKNRLTGSFDWFRRTTADMVGPGEELPNILGKNVPDENNTELKSTGWELSLKWQDRLRNGLGYSVGVLLSDSQAEITKYPNPSGTLTYQRRGGAAVGGITVDAVSGGNNERYLEGQKMGEIWGYETIGIAKTQAEMDAHLASLPNGGQVAVGKGFGAGDIMYKDVNGDGKISSGSNTMNDHGDLAVIGNNTARYNFGLDIGADFKGFDLRLFFQGTLKRDFASADTYFFGAQSNETAFLTNNHMDYFRGEANHEFGQNIDAYFPRPIIDSENAKNARIQTKYLQNAAYIRLKNLQVGYTIPQRITNKFGVSYLRVFFSGENLWTGTKLADIYDPETLLFGGTNSRGSAYPLQRTLSFGVSLSF